MKRYENPSFSPSETSLIVLKEHHYSLRKLADGYHIEQIEQNCRWSNSCVQGWVSARNFGPTLFKYLKDITNSSCNQRSFIYLRNELLYTSDTFPLLQKQLEISSCVNIWASTIWKVLQRLTGIHYDISPFLCNRSFDAFTRAMKIEALICYAYLAGILV